MITMDYILLMMETTYQAIGMDEGLMWLTRGCTTALAFLRIGDLLYPDRSSLRLGKEHILRGRDEKLSWYNHKIYTTTRYSWEFGFHEISADHLSHYTGGVLAITSRAKRWCSNKATYTLEIFHNGYYEYYLLDLGFGDYVKNRHDDKWNEVRGCNGF